MRSDFYVYMFFNETWNEPFYIGKGTGSRIKDNKRNNHVKNILNHYPCKRVILMNNLTNEEALMLENQLKDTLISLGKPIIDYERRYTSQNQMKGIQEAKLRGKYKGRRPIQIDDDVWKKNYERYQRRELNKGELAMVLKISRPTLNKMIKEVNCE